MITVPEETIAATGNEALLQLSADQQTAVAVRSPHRNSEMYF